MPIVQNGGHLIYPVVPVVSLLDVVPVVDFVPVVPVVVLGIRVVPVKTGSPVEPTLV